MSLTAIGVGMAALAVIGGGLGFCDKQCRKSHRPAARSSRKNS